MFPKESSGAPVKGRTLREQRALWHEEPARPAPVRAAARPRLGGVSVRALIFIVACSGAFPAALPAAAEDARSLVKQVLDSKPDVPFVSKMRMTTPGNLEREFTTSVKPLDDQVDGRYIEVTAPFNLHDIRYLFYERTEGQDEQFVYLPSLKRVIRMTEKTRREPFLGSTFYILDLVAPALDDFTYRFVGDEEVGGRACRLVESTPKNPDREFYGRSVFAIDPKDLVVMRAQLHDRNGSPFKVHTIVKIEKIDEWWTPRLQTMADVQDGTSSRLETLEIEYRVPLSDDIFHIGHLGR